MSMIPPDILAALAIRTVDSEDLVLLSDGRRLDLERSGLSLGRVSLAWSPSARWLGVRRGSDVLILSAATLKEAWRSSEEGSQSCCWDVNRDRLLVQDGSAWRSFVPVAMGESSVWMAETEDSGVPGSRGEFWATLSDEETGADRPVIMPARGFAASPLAGLPVEGALGPFDWAPDGRSAAWLDEEGIHYWPLGKAEARVLLRRRARLWSCGRLAFSPDGAHLLLVDGFADTEGTLAIIVRVEDGAAIELPHSGGPLGIVEWAGTDELYLASDLVHSAHGAEYRRTDRVRLSELPTPWRLRPALTAVQDDGPVSIPLPHHAGEAGARLQPLPSGPGMPLRLDLHAPGSTAPLCRIEAASAPAGGMLPVAAYLEQDCRCIVAGLSGETGQIALWGSFRPDRPLPAMVTLTWGPGKSLRAPVVSRPGTFETALQGVGPAAFWLCRNTP